MTRTEREMIAKRLERRAMSWNRKFYTALGTEQQPVYSGFCDGSRIAYMRAAKMVRAWPKRVWT